MKIYQVLNESGYPASTDGNADAIFLSLEGAEAHVSFLYDECGLTDMNFDIITLPEVKINYFVLSSEEGRSIGILQNSGDKEAFKNKILTMCREHYVYDEFIDNLGELDPLFFENNTQTLTVELKNDDEPICAYDVRIESVLMY